MTDVTIWPRLTSSRRYRGFAAVLPIVAGIAACWPHLVQAQVTPVPPIIVPNGVNRAARPMPRNLLNLLQQLDYDTTQYVPLVVVNPLRWLPSDSPLPERLTSLAMIADLAELRVVSPGKLNALVPRTLKRINDKPGTANPFEDLGNAEALKALAGTLTAAQWKRIGSSDGLGIADLDPDQQLLWARIMPRGVNVQKSTLAAGDEPGQIRYTDSTVTQITQPTAIRLRINKRVNLGFSHPGSQDVNYFGNPYREEDVVGTTKTMAFVPGNPDDSRGAKLYGASLIVEDANLQKRSDVDYAATSLDPRISLHFDPRPLPPTRPENPLVNPSPDFGAKLLPTIDDVLPRINAETRLHFVADRRVRDLPVYFRGDTARAGDLLQAFARSVGGTFRKLPPSHAGEATLYLLTSDIDGLGTQAARLGDWAEAAEQSKRKIQDETNAQAAKNNALGSLSFAADDPYALSATQSEAIESGWRKQKYASAPELNLDDMSPALQEGVRKSQREAVAMGKNLRTDQVRVGETLSVSIVLPGIGTFPDDTLGWGVGNQYIEEIAFDPTLAKPAASAIPSATAASKPVGPFGFPPKVTRRLLVVAPKTPEEITKLVGSASAHGFTDLCLQVGLADPVASTRILAAGVKAGQANHLVVGASVALLRDSGIPGAEPERNILGETGDIYAAHLMKNYESYAIASPEFAPYVRRMSNRYIGWTAADPADLSARLAPIAAVPGLQSLTLRATAAPGWAGRKEGGDGIQLNGAMGYTLSTRRAFLSAYGIDPIDIIDKNYPLQGVSWNVGLFGEDDGQGQYTIVNNRLVPRPAAEVPILAWWDFRTRTNTAMLAGFYAAIHKERPTLPLYLDDRASPYTEVDSAYFGSWDAPDRLPEYPIYRASSEVHAAARATSKTLIALWGDGWKSRIGTVNDTPEYFASRLTIVAKANQPPGWDGVAVDLAFLPTADVLRLLTGLPPGGTLPAASH